MNRNFKNKNRGISILGILLLGLILIFGFSYFNISLESIIESPKVNENMDYIGGVLENIWDDYLKKPATYVWKKLIIENFEYFRDNNPIDFNELAPTLPQ